MTFAKDFQTLAVHFILWSESSGWYNLYKRLIICSQFTLTWTSFALHMSGIWLLCTPQLPLATATYQRWSANWIASTPHVPWFQSRVVSRSSPGPDTQNLASDSQNQIELSDRLPYRFRIRLRIEKGEIVGPCLSCLHPHRKQKSDPVIRLLSLSGLAYNVLNWRSLQLMPTLGCRCLWGSGLCRTA